MLIYPTQSSCDTPVVSIDLVRAYERSDYKPEGWTKEDAIKEARRYEQFLCLAAAFPGRPVTPTSGIDFMWHLHMLSPKAYYEDCMRLFGQIFDHDGGFGKDEGEAEVLKGIFEQTSQWWQMMYAEPYVSCSTEGITKCWHDCVGRCWHACSSTSPTVAVAA